MTILFNQTSYHIQKDDFIKQIKIFIQADICAYIIHVGMFIDYTYTHAMYTLAGAGASRFGLTENKQGLSQSSMILTWESIKENKKKFKKKLLFHVERYYIPYENLKFHFICI